MLYNKKEGDKTVKNWKPAYQEHFWYSKKLYSGG